MFLVAITKNEISQNFKNVQLEELKIHPFIITVVTDNILSKYSHIKNGFSVIESPYFSSSEIGNIIFSQGTYHQQDRSFTIGRSTISGRPIFYTSNARGDFYCSTHISLLRTAGVPINEDTTVLPEFFIYRHIMPPKTLYKNIKRLLMGEQLLIKLENDKCVIHPITHYIPPRENQELKSITEGAAELYKYLSETLKRLEPAKDETTILLSGGIDSSVISTIYKKIFAIDNSYSTGYPFEAPGLNDEKKYAITAGKALEMNHRYYEPTSQEFLVGMVEGIFHAEEPLHHLQSVLLHLLWKNGISREQRIILCAQGAGSTFGYNDFFYLNEKRKKLLYRLLINNSSLLLMKRISKMVGRGGGLIDIMEKLHNTYPLDHSKNPIWSWMDFGSSSNGIFDDDRIGWTTDKTSTSSNYQFGVQLDDSDGDIVTYWRNSAEARVQQTIATYSGITANTFYRFRANITKLSATAAKIDVTLTKLDGSGNEIGVVATGSVANTSSYGSDTPATRYFTATTMWPTFKSYSTEPGDADNAYYELITTTQIENFTFIALPDVQNYNDGPYAAIGLNQTQWVVSNSDNYNIVYVCNEGDLVNTPSVTSQYVNANVSFSVLLNTQLPFTLIPGNHDTYDGLVNYNLFFPASRFNGKTYYGGHYGTTNVNNYVLFNASGMSFIAIGLEYNPSTAVLNWADGLLQNYSSRRAIVAEHCVLDVDATWEGNGQTIYDTLKDNSNLFLILCGHMHGENRRTETYNGNTVYLLLADYQNYANGGNGYLRMMEFCPLTNEIKVKTYSPYLNLYETDANSQFTLSYNMSLPQGEYTLTINKVGNGTVTPASGSIYPAGTVVDVEAIADSGWQFSSWSGDLSGTDNSTTITMNSDKTITATFVAQTPSAGWTAYNDFSGLDPANVAHIPTGSNGNLINYASGATLPVILTVSGGNDGGTSIGHLYAGTDAYKIFNGKTDPNIDIWWYGTDHSMVFTGLDSTKKYRFVHYADRGAYNDRYSNVIISDVDSFVTNSSTGVTISTTTMTGDTATYRAGNNTQGYVAGFTNIQPGADGDFTITVGSNDAHEYTTAIMLQELSSGAPPTQYTLTTSVVGSGTITKNPNQATYDAGTVVTVTANPATGWQFSSWSGNLSGSTSPTTITMNGNKTVTATFTEIPPAPEGIMEDFNTGFTVGQTVGAHADWYDGGGGPVVTADVGVAGSIGLAPAANIFTWEAQPFNWSDPDFLGVNVQMDFESSGAGTFDDDRVGWMTTNTSTSSDYIFGAQLDSPEGGIMTYWRNSANARVQQLITTYSGITADTYYRFRANITKLGATAAKMDVTLTKLDGSGNEVGIVASGSVANTSSYGSNAPATRYFTATKIWPAFKNYNALVGDADNAYYQLLETQSWLVIYNPYENVDFATANQYKGNFHTHTTFSDGSSTPDAVIYYYHNIGHYDILALTDHSHNTWPWSTWIAEDPAVSSNSSEYYPDLQMLAISGNEASGSDNVGCYLTDFTGSDYNAAFQYMQSHNGLAIFMHPGRYSETVSWYNNYFDTYDDIVLGVEAYNQGDRYPNDRIKWDSINKERDPANLIWGYSNDDMHSLSGNAFRNYQHFLMKALNESEFRTAMINGAFYFSYEPDGTNQANPLYGHAKTPKLTNVIISGDIITITGQDYTTVQWYNQTTSVVGTGTSIDLTTLSYTNFVRAVFTNANGSTYTQPFGFEEYVPPESYTLTVNTVGSGSITKDPDQTLYVEGTDVELTATANTGYSFTSWSGNIPTGHETDNPLTITMDANKTITATFTALPPIYYILTINVVGSGTVTPASGTSYLAGTIVPVQAIPGSEYKFVSWSGALTGTANPTNITMDSNKTITATFVEATPPTVILNSPADDTTVTSSSVEFNCTLADNVNLHNVTLYTGMGTPIIPGSVSVRVSTGTDDAEEYITDGYTYYTSTDLELGYDDAHSPNSAQIVGTRFNNIQIPQGATITNAYVEFECDVGTHTGDVPLQITGEDIDNAPTFTGTSYSISSRTDTTATVPWTITAQWAVDSKYPSPNINSVIQEIIDRSGWSSGNSMVIMFTASGSNRRETEAYEGGEASTAAPRLVVEYTTGGDITWTKQETKSISGTSSTTTFTVTLADGGYKWNCKAFDESGNSAFAPSDFDLTVSPPAVYYTLTTSVVGSGTVTPASGSSYVAGTVVNVEAIPSSNWKFDSWSGNLSGIDNTTTITMNSNKTITATFLESLAPTVTLNSPVDDSTVTSTSVEFNITATDNIQLKNATLYYGSLGGGGGGAITLVQQKTYAHPYPSTHYEISVTLNTPATANNLLVTGVAIDKDSGTITIPTGFNLVQKGQGGIASGAMAYKIATGGETTISWSWVNDREGSVWIGEYSGLATTDVLDVSAENEAYLSTLTNTISTGTTPTTTQADELAIALFASDSGNSVGSTRSWTNGFTTIAEITDTSGSPFVNVGSKTLTAIGTVESTLTHNGNDESYAMVATFKALPSGTPWHAQETKTISGTTTTTTFTVTLADGNYKWNCLVYDEAGNSAFATSDYDLTVNTTVPPIYYTLTTNISGNGTVLKDPDLTLYAEGTIVELTADADLGWEFVNWTGDITSTENPVNVTMDSNKTITATFTEIIPLTGWYAYNDLAGTASPDPATNYRNTMTTPGYLKNYATGETLGVSVLVAGGHIGDGTGPGVLPTGTDANITFYGKINPDAVLYYGSNHVFTFTGLDPSKTYRFVHWADRARSDYTARYSKVIISDITSFTTNSSTGVTISTTTMTDDTANYTTGYNSVNGYVAGFTNINPGADGDMIITVTSTNNYHYSSAFMLQELPSGPQPPQYALTIIKVGNGTVTPTSGSTYPAGTVVDVEAIPDPRWEFTSWTGNLTGTDNSTTITMNSNKTITATFTEIIPSTGWYAYNDLAGAATASPTTNYHSGQSGLLKDYATGTVLGVSVSVSGGTNNMTGPGVLPVGTDAYNIFSGKINLDNYILHYTNGPHVFTFIGLDPSKTYRFVHWADRADSGNTYNSTVTISDVTSFTKNSSAAVTHSQTTLPDDTASYYTGYNSVHGYVAGFTNINPGSDGDIIITVSGTLKYYSGAFMLQELVPVQMNFTIIALPDTQNYAQFYPEIFTSQTQWIVANREALNIVYVTNEGDIVNNGGSTTEYGNANTSISLLENPVTTQLPDGIPLTMIPGNHDGTTLFNQYFGVSRFTGRSYYGGHYSTTNDNNYVLFNASGMKFVAIGLQYNPDSAVLSWADNITQTYSDRRAIVISHDILNTAGGWDGPGQTIYDTLKHNTNLFLLLCGHNHGEARRTDNYSGNTVYSLLADFQSDTNGGNGYLRIMTFCPATNEIQVKTYTPGCSSPYIAPGYLTDANSQFTLSYNMSSGTPPENQPPAVTLNSPINNSLLATSSVTFNCTSTDDNNLQNVTLYLGSADQGTSGSVNIRVSTGTDDAEEYLSTHAIDLVSTDLELIQDPNQGNQEVGMRFQNVAIPQGASITNAYIEFEVDELNSDTTNLNIYGQAIDNAPTFTPTTSDITSRTKTSSFAAWNNIPAWDTESQKKHTPDTSAVIQEIINRPGWTSGNSIALILTGTGHRTAESYEGESANAPLLVVNYTIGGGGGLVWHANQTKTISGTTNTTTFTVTLPDGSYRWNCLAYDDAGNSTFAPADYFFNVSAGVPLYYTLTTNVVGNGTVTPASGSSYLAGTVVPVEAIPDSGWQFDHWSGNLTGNDNTTTITMDSNKTINATFIEIPTTEFIAYNDLVGTSIPDNVTEYDYATTNGVLKDFTTGSALSVTMTGSYTLWDMFTTNGGNFNAGTDAYLAFNGIVDVTGTFELESVSYQNIIGFNNLNPNKAYTITLTGNRNEPSYLDQRYVKVTIEGAQTYTQASSTGVVINSDTSVSFSIGYNTVNGYVAKWTGVTSGPDGSFSIKSEWDNSFAGAKGYAISAFCLEEIGAVSPQYTLTINKLGNGTVTPASGLMYPEGTVVDVEAIPDPGWEFTSWNGDLSGTDNTTTITMDGDKSITATFIAEAASTGWTAYNDLAGSSQPPTFPNVTNYHPTQSGALKNYVTGATLPVSVAVSGGSNNGSATSSFTSGTDAYNIFYGKINPDLIIAYSGGNHYFTFIGLDPSKTYRFVHWADRGDIGYNNTRYSTVTISDITSFTTNSSSGVTISMTSMTDDSATYCTGYNSLRGYVAGFTNINPGSDGDMTITVTSSDSTPHQYSSAFMLQELPSGTPPTQYTLTTNVVGNGIVTKDPDQTTYDEGTSVELNATAASGWEFTGWSGDVPSGHETDNPLTITMDADKTINATFIEETPQTITLVQQKTYAHPNGSPSTGISVTLNATATANNLLITGVAIDKASGIITAPTGFTLVQKGEGGVSSGALAYKIASGDETTISWTWTASQMGSVWVGEYSGLATTNVLDVSAENETYLSIKTTTISTGTTPTTTQADELAIALFASDSGNSVGSTRTWTNGFTTLAEITDTPLSGSPFVNVASKILDATGTVESTLNHNGNDESYAMVATFKALTS